MDRQQKTWESLINIVFNDTKEVPIELISEFRNLAQLHRLEYYCDFLRDKKLPDTLKREPWEVEWLKKLSKILNEGVQVLVLKGAAARDLDLYPYPLLRQTSDLDLFVYRLESFEEKINFVDLLSSKLGANTQENWKSYLRKLNIVTLQVENNSIDLHFELFSPLGNTRNPILGLGKKNKNLEDDIIKRATLFKSLKNICKMSYEDFWLYNIFHFLKNYPLINLGALLDSFLVLRKDKSTLEKIKKHAKMTNQLYLYYFGLLLFGQLYKPFTKEELKINWVYKKIFDINRIISLNSYSIKNRLIVEFSKGVIAARGNVFLSFVYGFFYLIINNFIRSNIASGNNDSLHMFSNFITKIFYTITKFKNLGKSLCLRAAGIGIKECSSQVQILHLEKKLISLRLEDLRLTFNVPVEFYEDLEKVWRGFLTRDHLNQYINVEKAISETYTNIHELVFSDGHVYLKMSDCVFGKADLSSTGSFFAKSFWDVRNFALSLFRAMTFEREDLLLVHGSGVKIKRETLIFPAGTSAGKTTLFNLLTKNGALGINDDTVLLKKENGTWFVYPTPFMSNYKEPVTCEKSKLTGIIDPVKVCGGHEVRTIDKNYGNAILLNNSLSGFLIDDSGFLLSKIANKVINLSKQVLFYGQIKYSLDDEGTLIALINEWLESSNQVHSTSSHLIRLIELQGKSMEPTFKEGDILCVEETFPNKLKPKDVICFSKDPNDFPVVHRVKYLIKHKDFVAAITKGDGCIYEDLPNTFKSDQKVLKVINKANFN